MLHCKNTHCGHSWQQCILEGVTNVDDCPVCEQEREQEARERRLAMQSENRSMAAYYQNKYGE